MENALNSLTAHQARRLLRDREITSVELVTEALNRIEHVERQLHALVTVNAEQAMKLAGEADMALAEGKDAPLLGVPVVIKDNMCTRGVRTTCSSKMLENFVPPYDATVVSRLCQAGAIVIAKANMDEFAMGSSTEHSAFFPTRNPWDVTRVPGGSSGGSAVAVAADECMLALGSDTGGSIRQPAGFCSVVGLKPTYGRVSRFGLIAFASSLDQIGPLAKDVEDCALAMNIISGADPCDSTSVNIPVPDYRKSLNPDIRGLRLGVPREYFVSGMQPEVEQSIRAAIQKLQDLGASVDWDVSLPHTKYALAAYYIIAPSEASANLARYDGVKYGYSYAGGANIWDTLEKTRQYGFGPEVKRRIMLGTYALSAGYYEAYYVKAQKVRTLIRQEFDAAFEKYDALVTPASPTVPFKIGERLDDLIQMYLSDVCTLPVNIAGIPAVTVPAGFCDGLPVGMQVMGRPFSEELLLRVAYAFEQATQWHTVRPGSTAEQ